MRGCLLILDDVWWILADSSPKCLTLLDFLDLNTVI